MGLKILHSIKLNVLPHLTVAGTLLLVSCGGGSGGSPNPFSEDETLGSAAPFTGRMVGTQVFDNTLRGVNLNSGRFLTLPGSNQLLSLGALRNDASVQTERDRSVSSGILITVDDCSESQAFTVCFYFLDRNGNITSQFNKESEFPGAGKVSYDGSHVVVDFSDRTGGASTVIIYTREGEFVSGYSQSGVMSDRAYDWLPDGRLVFSMEGNALLGDEQPTGFIVTEPFSTTPAWRITLPDFYQEGRIHSMESSPDGSQLLINISPRVGPARPIFVEMDTWLINQFIDNTQSPSTDVKNVSFGPDGGWVYAVISSSELQSGPSLDSSLGDTIVFIGSSDTLFAFEVNGNTHPMPLSQNDLSSSLVLMPTDRPRDPGGEVGGGQFDGNLVWIP